MNKIRLLVASDNQAIRRSLVVIFESESVFEVVGNTNLEKIIDSSVLVQPDVILIDLPESKHNHDIAVNEIKNECPYTLILVLSGNTHSDTLAKVLDQDIDGCLPRSIMRDTLVKTVEVTCQANIFCLPSSLKKRVLFIKPSDMINIDQMNSCKTKKILTKREMEILQLMAENCSNRDIANKLFISEPTVKTHVSSILRKLGQNNRSQAIVYSYRIGLVKNQ